MNDALTRCVTDAGSTPARSTIFMKYITYILTILLLSCSDDNFSIYDEIIQQDLYNKQTELNILRELYIAQQNHDEEAFKFYVTEYVRAPRLKLTTEEKQHPDFREWLTDEQIKSGVFMSKEWDYITE